MLLINNLEMKNILSLLLFYVLFLNTSTLNAQDTYNPWSVGLGINAVNNPISGMPEDIDRYKTWNQDAAGFRITGARYIKKGFVFQTDIFLNTIKENDPNSNEEYPYISFDGMFKYNLNSSAINLSMFDPYISVGGGYAWLDQIGAGTLNGGIGLNLWLSDHFGFNVQSVYKHAFKEYGIKHFQHSTGIVFKFGGIDTDNDGIFDNEDSCPNDFGLIQFNGCPDTDGDGVKESLDECPLIAGSIALNGCPDKDKDGVADKNDECPEVKGNLNTRGCPDKDKDGVPDKFDRCPEVAGSFNNNGCPWEDTDKDGVLDKDDKCPNQIGPVNNGGCPFPKLSQIDQISIDTFAKTILFNLGKADLKLSSNVILDSVVTIMKKYKKERFHIAGHTDNTFTKDFNLTLSQDRANAVRNYLISKGIEASRLTANGYGEEKPAQSNNTNKGRRSNRRVKIILIK